LEESDLIARIVLPLLTRKVGEDGKRQSHSAGNNTMIIAIKSYFNLKLSNWL
jgi:hypothetical protein